MDFEQLSKHSVLIFLTLLVGGAATAVGLAVANNVPDTPHMAPMALNSYTQVPSKIVSAHVFDTEGKDIGTVQKIDLDPSGKPNGLEVLLSGTSDVISVAARDVSYDEEKNVAAVELTREQGAATTPKQPR